MKTSRVHRVLLRALPRATRLAAGEELASLFVERLARARRRGLHAAAALWVGECADIARTAIAERFGRVGAINGRRAPRPLSYFREIGLSVRQLRRAPGALGLAVATLALGLGASVTTYVLVRDVLVRPLPFHSADRLVRLVEVDASKRSWWPSYPNCLDWRRTATHVFDALGCADPDRSKPVVLGGVALKVRAARASAGLFEALEVRPAVGRLFVADENRPGGSPAALVSHRFWRTSLGSRPIDGLTINIGAVATPVVGVLPENFAFIGEAGAWTSADVWTPLERDNGLGGRSSHGYHTVGRLRAGVTVERATAEMARISKNLEQEHKEFTQADSVGMRPLQEYVTHGAAAPLRILSWAAAAVLLVSCFNFGATILSRGLDRQRELRMRLALGATRGDLVRLVIADALALALPATMLGLGISAASLGWMRVAAADALPRMSTVALDWRAAGLAALVASLCATAAALAPALALSSRALAGGLNSRGAIGESRPAQRLWTVLLAAQVGLTLLLLCESGLLLRSFIAATNVDLGYRADGVIAVELTPPSSSYETDDALLTFYRTVADRLRVIPGVEAVGLTSALAVDTQSMAGSTSATGRPKPAMYLAAFRLVDGDYFRVMGIPVLANAVPLARGGAYVDAVVARTLWGGQSPIGGEVLNSFPGVPMQVTGIVGAVRQWSDEAGPGAVYAPLGSAPGVFGTMHAVVRFNGDLSSASPLIREAVASVNSLVPVDPRPMASLNGELLQTRRVIVVVALSFTAIAFLLACAGTYAMVLFAVRRRLREAAIRIALGAAAGDVRARFVKIGLVPSMAGLVAGALATKPAGKLVAAQLFRVSPGDPAVLAVAVLALAAAASVAAILPARRAANADPVTLLRDE